MIRIIAVFLSVSFVTGCAASLSTTENIKYEQWEHEKVLIEEKNPGLGAVLGILPGFGSFYAREPLYGVLNLLVWPVSVLWDPVSGYNGSRAINYNETFRLMAEKKEKEIQQLQIEKAATRMSDSTFLVKKMAIEDKYK